MIDRAPVFGLVESDDAQGHAAEAVVPSGKIRETVSQRDRAQPRTSSSNPARWAKRAKVPVTEAKGWTPS
jgi:hypothetical protein